MSIKSKKLLHLSLTFVLILLLAFANVFISIATVNEDEENGNDVGEYTGSPVCPTDEHSINEEWTYDENSHWKECTVCGTKFEVAEHSFGDWVTDIPASTTEPGSKHRECNVCGYKDVASIPQIDDSYIPGDIDGDKEVTNQDLIRLFQYLSGWDVDVNNPALDVDGDEEVTNQDLIRLFQYLSGWDVEIN